MSISPNLEAITSITIVNGYSYRGTRGSAWNVATPEYLRAIDRNGWSPRGRLNDAGFRCAYYGA